ncbi:MAG TPA: MaoC family dehydratase [Solirubrobacterales bacterium]|nr:MaoC family dehydratase [Solirubrobacterales bacterium]
MASVEVNGIEGMRGLLGKGIGPSEWRTVTQADIDTFAELSGDDQWIHVDVERAKSESPFGTTIAHGNLTLSLVDGFRKELISATGFALGVNYGWDKIRFPAPVPVDSRVRARAEVVSIDDKGGGWYQVVTRFTLEVEGNEKSCFVGDSVTRVMAPPLVNSGA